MAVLSGEEAKERSEKRVGKVGKKKKKQTAKVFLALRFGSAKKRERAGSKGRRITKGKKTKRSQGRFTNKERRESKEGWVFCLQGKRVWVFSLGRAKGFEAHSRWRPPESLLASFLFVFFSSLACIGSLCCQKSS